MNYKIFFIIVLLYLKSFSWIMKYDLPSFSFHSLVQTSDNAFVFIGNDSLVNIVKTDSVGNIIWSKYLDSVGYASIIQSTYDGGALITPKSGLYNDSAVHLIKIDSVGNHIWTKDYICRNRAQITAINKTHDSCFVVSISGETDFFSFMKIDSNGDTLWYKEWWDPIEYLSILHTFLFQSPDSSYLELHTMMPFSMSDHPYSTFVKRNEAGEIIQLKWYGTEDDIDKPLYGMGLLEFDDGYLLAGHKLVEEISNLTFLKLNINGDSLWLKTHEDYVTQAALYNLENGFDILGVCNDTIDDYTCLINFTRDCDMLSTKRLSYEQFVFTQSIKANDGDYVLIGGIEDSTVLIKDPEFNDISDITSAPRLGVSEEIVIERNASSKLVFYFPNISVDNYPINFAVYDTKGALIENFANIDKKRVYWPNRKNLKGVYISELSGRGLKARKIFSILK